MLHPTRALLLAAIALVWPALSAGEDTAKPRPSPGPQATSAPPAHSAADPGAPAVTAKNLLASERSWPYRVALTEPWQPPGAKTTLKRGHVGVLIRVESSGNPRIDFGMRGKYEVPTAKTDLVERSNEIRLGKQQKEAPNFVYAIRTRMIDAASEGPRIFPAERVHGHPGFLCVFADPSSEDFPKLAEALVPLSERHGVMTIFFPIGNHDDAKIRKQLRELGWTPPFLHDFLSEGYIRTLVSPDTAFPALLLQTDEGRLLYLGAADPERVPELTAVLDASFG